MTVELRVSGRTLTGFTRGQIQLSMDELANSFDVEYIASGKQLGERFIVAGDAVRVLIDGHTVIDGYVDTTDDEDLSDAVRLRAAGRSNTADLVDCSAAHQSFRGMKAGAIVQAIAKPYGIVVRVEGVEGGPFHAFVVQKGETGADAIARCTRPRGLYAFAVGSGLVLSRAGSTLSPTRLVRGELPLKSSAHSDSWYARHSEYVFRGQVRATDSAWGKAAAQLKNRVVDEEITRYRPLLLQVEAHGPGDLTMRATIARNQHAGQGHRVRAVVAGFVMDDGRPWQPNLRVAFRNPVLGLDTELLVSTVRMRFSESGPDETELELLPPSAYEIGKNRAAKEKGQRGVFTK